MRTIGLKAALAMGAGLAVTAGPASTQTHPLSGVVCANGGPTYAPYLQAKFTDTDTGTPMLRVTLNGPNSRCNDGTPAFMYVRPPGALYTGQAIPSQAHRQERWVIVFEGGGGCPDKDKCLERWCGLTGMDRAAAMSSHEAYDAIPGANGVFRRNPAVNHFAGYNHVLLRYCSSDNWIGSGSHVSLDSGGTLYDIEFNGEAVVNDAIARLLDGVTPDPNLFWANSMPSLRTAEEVVLVGISAGGVGLRHHLDRLRDLLRQEVTGDVRVIGVIDAGNPPALWDPNINWGGAVDVPTSYADFLLNVKEPTVRDFWGADDSALDASCLDQAYAAAHAAVGGHPQVCYDTTYTLFNHIETPFFARADINDLLQREMYLDRQLFPSLPLYWDAQHDLLTALIGFGGGLQPVTTPPGVFGPTLQRAREHAHRALLHRRRHAARRGGGRELPRPAQQLAVGRGADDASPGRWDCRPGLHAFGLPPLMTTL